MAEYRPYPFAICRLGGRPFDLVDSLRSDDSLRRQAALDRRRDDLATAREELLEALGSAIGAHQGDPRRKLLRAARKLRRQHKLSDAQQGDMVELGLEPTLAAWRRAGEAADTALRHRDEAYGQDLVAGRRAIRRLAQDEPFLQGLVLASPVLHRSFVASLESPFESLPYNREQRRLELSLVKYASRSAAKTTPFSTFSPIAAASLEDPGGDASEDDTSAAASWVADSWVALPQGDAASSVTLNKVIYALLHPFFESHAELFPLFSVTLNPSFHATEEGFAMLLSRQGRESWVSLGASPAVARVAELLRRADGTMPYTAFVEALAEDLGTDRDALRPRVDRMLGSGLLGLNSHIADAEPRWAERLVELLGPSEETTARTLRQQLQRMQGKLADYGAAASVERAALLEGLQGDIDALEKTLSEAETGEESDSGDGVAADRVSGDDRGAESTRQRHLRALRQSPLYEDTHLPVAARLHAGRLRPVLETLAVWVERSSRLTLRRAFHANLRVFYDRHFGDRPRLGFPTFYRHFYHQVFEKILQVEHRMADSSFDAIYNPFGLDLLPNARRASEALVAHLRRLWAADPQAENLHFDRRAFTVEDLPPLFPRAPGSVNVFSHLLPAGAPLEHDALLVEKAQALAGHGKYFSRFLHGLGGSHGEALRAHNRRHDGMIIAELCDDSAFSFNANLHPPLTDAEINYPAPLTGFEPRRNLPLADLEVCPDGADRHRLRLIHRPTQRDVLPVDLGFLNPTRRPPLLRVLGLFSGLFQHQQLFPWSLQDGMPPPEDQVVYRPRMVFEDRLVLGRRAWRVPAAVLHRLLDGASPAAAMHRLDRWRRSLGMPEEVFFHSQAKVRGGHEGDTEAGEKDGAPAGSGRTYSHKPQYSSFSSVLLVQLLCEELRHHEEVLVFEEMLPSRHALAQRQGRPHVAEWVLQLDRDPDA